MPRMHTFLLCVLRRTSAASTFALLARPLCFPSGPLACGFAGIIATLRRRKRPKFNGTAKHDIHDCIDNPRCSSRSYAPHTDLLTTVSRLMSPLLTWAGGTRHHPPRRSNTLLTQLCFPTCPSLSHGCTRRGRRSTSTVCSIVEWCVALRVLQCSCLSRAVLHCVGTQGGKYIQTVQ